MIEHRFGILNSRTMPNAIIIFSDSASILILGSNSAFQALELIVVLTSHFQMYEFCFKTTLVWILG